MDDLKSVGLMAMLSKYMAGPGTRLPKTCQHDSPGEEGKWLRKKIKMPLSSVWHGKKFDFIAIKSSLDANFRFSLNSLK